MPADPSRPYDHLLGTMPDGKLAALVSTPDAIVSRHTICRRRISLGISPLPSYRKKPRAPRPQDPLAGADLTGSWPELMARYPGVSRGRIKYALTRAGIRMKPEQRMRAGRKLGSKMPPRKPKAAPVAPPVAPPMVAPVATPAPVPRPVPVQAPDDDQEPREPLPRFDPDRPPSAAFARKMGCEW